MEVLPMIYSKTPLGQSSFQNRSVSLTPRQRSAFILFDGKRGIDEVLKAMAGLGVTPDDVNHLVSLGLIASPMSPIGATATATTTPTETATATATATAIPAANANPVETVASAPPSAALSFNADGLPTVSAQAHYSKAYPIATRLTARLGLRGFRLNLAVEAAGDLDKLKELAPKIREAVGPEKFLELENALYY